MAEIWSELALDKFLVVSEYVEGLALDPVPIMRLGLLHTVAFPNTSFRL